MKAPGETERGGSEPSSTPRLLVVEDDGVVARDVERSLEEMGYRVADVVPKGEWALTAAREHVPDLVLMDIRLAGEMDGVEAGRAILEELDVPVVYLTAYADDETRSRARESTPFGYVVKPFTDRDLKTTVEVALLRHGLERELEAERARLAERVKEQSCLYDVSRILRRDDRTLEGRLQAVVARLPEGWQHPEVTVARLRLDEGTWRSEGYRPPGPALKAPVEVGGQERGELEVGYREERPEEDVGPFLEEERRLLDEVADRLAAELRRIEIREQMRRLADIVESTSDFVAMSDARGRILWANSRARRMLGVPDDEGLEGTPLSACLTDRAAREVAEQGLPTAREEGVWEGETSLVTREGEEIPVSQVIVAHGRDEDEVAYYSTIARDVTERKQFEAQLQERALHDYLTGLPNRALFRDRLEHALDRAGRVGERLAVLFVDLKRFKVVNDSLGHDAGDQVLKEVARRLDATVRSPDTVARIGGDEFTVLLEDVEDEEDAVEVAERLVGVFQDPMPLGDRDVPMEASIGVAVHEARRSGDVDGSELIRRADAAMYRAKKMPGTRHAVADPSDERARPGRLERETRLRRALEEGRIRTVYQPIYSLASGAIRGVEALARWRDPELGDVPPGTFIPIAEETGLIIRLGEQQMRRACSQLLEDGFGSPDAGGPMRLHVNLSARQLEDPDVVERTVEVLESTGFPPSRLCLEITESAAVRRPGAVEQLKEVGVHLAIDDFGTRYSTLSQVRRLRVDALKIDRTFVAGLPDDEEDRAIVETVLTLGRSLGLSVVAEGIEHAEQSELLLSLGCDEAQGFHLARPMPADDLRALLEREGAGGG